MAKATRTDTPISQLFQSPRLRAVFAQAERDGPPASLAVESKPIEPTLTPGAARALEMA